MTQDTLEDIYVQNVGKIHAFFFYKACSQNTAEDLTSETFLLFVDKVVSPESSVLDPEKFLYGIMRNVWIKHLKKKYQLKEYLVEDIDDFSAYVEETVASEEQLTDFARASRFIRRLPAKQQTVMKLRLLEQRTLQEICKILGKNMSYVKTTQMRGIKNLYIMIGQEEIGMNADIRSKS